MIAEGNGDDAGLVAGGSDKVLDAGRVGEIERGGYAGRFRIAGVLEEILNGAALDAGLGTPGAVGVGVAFEVAVVLRVRVDEYAGGAALLGEIDLDAAEVGAVADEDDFAVQVDVLGGELIEVFEAAVVGIDHFAGDVAGAGGAVEGHDDAGIVLAGVAVDVLSGGAGHEEFAGGVVGFDA